MNIVLLGAPGSGKGSLSKFLVLKYGLTHLSTGDIFREAISLNTELGQQVQQYVSTGRLVPDELVTSVVLDKLTRISGGSILDGYPRTTGQAEDLAKNNIEVSVVIRLDADFSTILSRLAGRQRADDTEAIIRKRFEVYREQTEVVSEFYKAHPRFITVNGNNSIAEVNHAVQAQLADHFIMRKN